jgi:hypothetical protein
MPESPAFEAACACLAEASTLGRLASRGTLRIALKQAGLEARTVTPQQLEVVVARVLPTELEVRGVANHAQLCEAIRRVLGSVATGTGADAPDTVFERLAGS